VTNLFRLATLMCGALALAGCIRSNGPILIDAKPLFGTSLRLQLYSIRDGYARDPERVVFAWDGHLYKRTAGGLRDIQGFTAHAFEGGGLIIQTTSKKPGDPVEFALAHKAADGVWFVVPIDESDADEATRRANCKGDSKTVCLIERREQLLAFARLTAARPKQNGGLALRLPDAARR
jgi:hypothetical protein